MIRTGYYKAKGVLIQPNPIFICRSISTNMQAYLDEQRHTPKRYMLLAPPYKEILEPWYNNRLTYNSYTDLYNELVLSKLNPHKVVEDLGTDPIMICYEKPGEFCHRHLVAKWLQTAGYPVEEYKYITPVLPGVSEWEF